MGSENESGDKKQESNSRNGLKSIDQMSLISSLDQMTTPFPKSTLPGPLTDIPINEFCSFVPCDDHTDPPSGDLEVVCYLCKSVPETWNETIGEICRNDPCFNPIRCQFCRVIHEIHNNLLSENLLNGSGEGSGDGSGDTSILVVEENAMKNNSKHHCRYVWCCPSRHICYEKKHRIQNARKCVKSWCCSYLQYCQLRSGNKLYHKY